MRLTSHRFCRKYWTRASVVNIHEKHAPIIKINTACPHAWEASRCLRNHSFYYHGLTLQFRTIYNVTSRFCTTILLWNGNSRFALRFKKRKWAFLAHFMDHYKQKYNVSCVKGYAAIENDLATFSKQYKAKQLHSVQVDILSWVNERSKYRFVHCIVYRSFLWLNAVGPTSLSNHYYKIA